MIGRRCNLVWKACKASQKVIRPFTQEKNEIEPSTSKQSDLMRREKEYLNPTKAIPKLRKKWHEISASTYEAVIPDFENLKTEEFREFHMMNTAFHLNNTLLWAPLIQKIDPSEELLEFLEDAKFEALQKDYRVMSPDQIIADAKTSSKLLVRNLIEDVLPNTGFQMIENYYCKPSKRSKMHGSIDFLLVDRANEGTNYGFPMCAVQVMKPMKEFRTGEVTFNESAFPIGAIAHWKLSKLYALMEYDKEFKERVLADERLSAIRLILTNGHIWRLYEFDVSFESRNTQFYTPRMVREIVKEIEGPAFEQIKDFNERKIWNDFKAVQLALGLIRFGMNTPNSQEKTLHETYEYLKELQYFDLMDEKDSKIIRRRERLARYLPKFMKKWIVGVDRDDIK
jgi:hypothetical protein